MAVEEGFKQTVLDNKGRIRMNELRLKALINLLDKEGVVIKDEIEEELDRLLKIGEKEEEKNS